MLPNFISETDFENYPLYISFATNSSSFQPLNDIITTYQKKIAIDLLGDIEFLNYENSWNNTEFTSDFWNDFTYGTNYTVGNYTYNWVGFKEMLKYFVYYYFHMHTYTKPLSLGAGKPKMENFGYVFDNKKVSEIYNLGVEIYGVDYMKLFNFPNKVFNVSLESRKFTAYNFLYNNQNEIPDWTFNRKGFINQFGI